MRREDALVVCGGVRTPFVRSFGQLARVPVEDLARAVIAEALARTGADPERLDEVVLGCAAQPVEAMNVARVAALRAGVPRHVPAFTVHRNCASGIEAIAHALLRVRAGDGGLMVAGGAESMSGAPFQLTRPAAHKMVAFGRAKGAGAKLTRALALRPRDLLARNVLEAALTDPISGLLMGDTAEVLAREFGIGRGEQDAYAAESQRRSAAARASGFFAAESMPFFVPPEFRAVVREDDGVRPDASVEKLAKLKPVFDRRFGTVTVGNACQVTDGATALVVASEAVARELSLPRLGRVLDVVTVGCDPRRMGLGPALAIPRLLERNGLTPDAIDLHELNEAFAVQVLAVLRALGPAAPPPERLNVHGGAIALGHPVGATGARLVLTLLHALRARGGRLGVASLCVGGGQGAAVLVESEAAS